MIELMVAIAIAGIITSAIGAFMLFHIKSYEMTKNIIDIQYEAQVGLESFSKMAMESMGLSAVNHYEGANLVDDLGDNSEVMNPTLIVFKSLDLNATLDTVIYYGFFIDYTKHEMYFAKNSTGDFTGIVLNNANLFMQYIDNITITPIGKDVSGMTPSYANTNAIQLQMTMKNRDTEFTISNQYEFRNKAD